MQTEYATKLFQDPDRIDPWLNEKGSGGFEIDRFQVLGASTPAGGVMIFIIIMRRSAFVKGTSA
jgi:hypothetical protein